MTRRQSHQGDDKLRMAVIGCGPIGRLHARAIVDSPHARLVAVCDPDKTRRGELEALHGVAGHADCRLLVESERLDAVTIATPDHLHVEPALAAIAADCHVFCEKPLAANLADGQRIVDAAHERGVRLGVDYNRRFAFGYRTARRLLEEGRIGRLDYGVLRVSDPVPPAEVTRHPAVIFTTLLTHHFDLLRYFGGEIRSLVAVAGDEAPGALIRSVAVTCKLASGAIGTIVAGYRDGQTRTSEWLELGGTSGAIQVEEITRRVTLSTHDPDQSLSFEPNPFVGGNAFYDSVVEHLQAFIAALADGAPPPVDGADGLMGMRLAEAAITSLSTGNTQQLGPP